MEKNSNNTGNKAKNHTGNKAKSDAGDKAKNPAGNNKSAVKSVLGGALIGSALGMVAGMLLVAKPGQKLRAGIKSSAADFYKYLAPKIKRLKTVGEKEYDEFIDTAVKAYGKAKKLSARDMQELKHNAKVFWKTFKKNI